MCERIDETTDLNYIKTVLDAPVPNNIDETKLQAIRTMYAARTSAPNTIEKTMSPRQLFQITKSILGKRSDSETNPDHFKPIFNN